MQRNVPRMGSYSKRNSVYLSFCRGQSILEPLITFVAIMNSLPYYMNEIKLVSVDSSKWEKTSTFEFDIQYAATYPNDTITFRCISPILLRGKVHYRSKAFVVDNSDPTDQRPIGKLKPGSTRRVQVEIGSADASFQDGDEIDVAFSLLPDITGRNKEHSAKVSCC